MTETKKDYTFWFMVFTVLLTFIAVVLHDINEAVRDPSFQVVCESTECRVVENLDD